MYKLIEGKQVAEKLRNKVKEEVGRLEKKPGLAIVLIGEDPASQIYVSMKLKKCKEVGLNAVKYELDESTNEKEVLDLIAKLNRDKNVNGILVQMPVPKHIDKFKIVEAVLPEKDVDGFHPTNIGKLASGAEGLQPATPRGIIKLLEHYKIQIEGKDAVVIGRSLIVGLPISQMLKNRNATVTVCHSRTRDVSMHTRNADIIVSAVGKRHMVTSDMIKEGAVIIDVGTVRENGKLYGDVDFEKVREKASYITPVPGGVGPMTIACLLENTLAAYKKQHQPRT